MSEGSISPALSRLALITGNSAVQKLSCTNVIVFGLGGVGSWCAEALVRCGVGGIALVDSDIVCVTNINRQTQATTNTIGQEKTECLKTRLLEINPECRVTAITKVFSQESVNDFSITDYDFVIDAIDSLTNKLDLIEFCLANQCVIFSCMGMAQKLDPEKIKSGDIWKTEGCPLARLVRNGLRKRHIKDHFTVVYSKERLPLHSGVKTGCGSGNCLCPKGSANIEWCSKKKVINGSSVTVTASAGMLLASLVIRNVVSSG